MSTVEPVAVLVAAGAAGWELTALERLNAASRRVAVVKRCLDITDLLATATAGAAGVAVVSADLPGLDADSVDRLARHGVRTVAVVASPAADVAVRTRLLRLGVARLVELDRLEDLADRVVDAARQQTTDQESRSDDPRAALHADEPPSARSGGRLVTVWGPPGGPGRTTVAIGVAAEAAARGSRATLVDADPYGAGAGLALAVLEEVSGLLAAARLANAGGLDPASLAQVGREVSTGLRLFTGLPRPDRWPDVRPRAFGEVLSVALDLDDLVVVDTGAALAAPDSDPYATGPVRDDMTRIAVERADVLVVVGAADPVGLTRLARALPDVVERRAGGRIEVVVNRMRPTLGWSEKEVRYLVEGVAPGAGVAFLPDDRAAADQALLAGCPLTEGADSGLRRAMCRLADRVLPGEPDVAGDARPRLALLRRR